MGRGRAKAKQTKVARELKYQTLNTDFDALQRELGGDSGAEDVPADDGQPDDDYDAADYGAYDDDEDEPRRRVG